MNVLPSAEHPVHDAPLPSLADPVPVSGRDQPHPEPVPSSFRHDVRFEAAERGGDVYIRAYCKPCKWSVALDNGHTPHDFVRLELQHLGVTA